MLKRGLLIFLLILPIVVAQTENYNDKTDLTIQYTSNGEINLQGSNGFDYLKTQLYLFPKTSQRQEVLSLTTNPPSDIGTDQIIYTWNSFQPNLEYSLTSQIKTKNQIYPVAHESFPIQNLDQEYEKYLEAGEIIDITPEIVNKASQLIGGETDLYTAVHKIAEWVNEGVEYDLNTVTADAALKSSWVLQNGEGVCDEITSLFISLLRSVGVPARFVSGIAYSNLNYGFENHGWAEVYFPNQGWVPYDVTFTQFGWIDPGHVTLSRSLDAGQTSVKYSWKSKNTELISSNFENNVQIVSEGQKIQLPFDMQIKVLVNEVGPGSYVPIQVIIENPYDKYLSDTISITKAPSLPLGGNQKTALLKPSQEKSIFFIVQVSDDLDSGYTYTSQIEAKDLIGKTKSTNLKFSSNDDTIKKSQAQEMISKLEEKEDKSYSEEISLNCNQEKKYYYDFEEPKVICEVKNIGNTFLTNVEICLEEDCQTKDLKIGVKELITFENVEKKSKLTATVKKDSIDLLSEISLKILQEPDLIITGFQVPKELDYNTEFNISFVLSSDAIVKDIKINIPGLKPLTSEKTQKAQTIIISANSKKFISENVEVKITYKDEYDREFEIKKQAEIKINNLPWHAKIMAFFKKLF
ncbi:hypothetical protein K8R33_00725 [archaeon]|nr:hypothetical protein [archaeon]